jgi:phage shock protein A
MVMLARMVAACRCSLRGVQESPDVIGYRTRKQIYDAKGTEADSEAQAARKSINAIIEDTSSPSDSAALARIESRIDGLMS